MRLALTLLLLWSPSLAVAGQYESIIAAAAAATRPAPTPTPTPPSGVCDNCDGVGTIGDGTIKVTCPVCKGTGKAQSAATPTAPAASNLPADAQPTPMAGVAAGLAALNPQPGQTLVVYGSGFDARWEITAARKFPGVKVIGIEIDPELAESARRYVKHAGLDDRITIVTADATTLPIAADMGAAYLWPETLAALKPKIEKLDAFVSYAHDVPGLRMQKSGDVYVYRRRQVVMQAQTVRPNTAVWNGRHYSGRVCGNPNCSMCAAISRQLQPQTVYRPVVVDAAATPARVWGIVGKRCRNGVCTPVYGWIDK